MSALLDIWVDSLHHSRPMPGFLKEPRQQAVILLFLGGFGLLISVMLAARAMEFEEDATPRRRILAHWLPIGAAVLLATLLGYGEMGVAMIFGTSVALLSVVTGFVVISGPLMDVPNQGRRMWPFLPVLATLVFVLGLRGTLGIFEVTALAVQGLLLFLLWGSVKYSSPRPQQTPTRIRPIQIVGLLAAVALTVVGAWAAVRGANTLSTIDIHYPGTVIAATLLSIALALPMVSSGVQTASEGRAAIAIGAQVAIVMLNFTVLLPGTILLRILMRGMSRPTTGPTSGFVVEPFLYPRLSWRIDAVAILILSLLLVPIAEGKFRLDRRLGGWLIFAYCVYLMTTLVVGAGGM
jgi:Ca2+/Na+ antiporter